MPDSEVLNLEKIRTLPASQYRLLHKLYIVPILYTSVSISSSFAYFNLKKHSKKRLNCTQYDREIRIGISVLYDL